MDRVLMRLRVDDLVTLGHDQRRATTLVHAAKPPGIKIQLAQLLFGHLVVLADLHRHTAARAGVAVAGNYNRLSSLSFHYCSG